MLHPIKTVKQVTVYQVNSLRGSCITAHEILNDDNRIDTQICKFNDRSIRSRKSNVT